jgi:hypothetical protein
MTDKKLDTKLWEKVAVLKLKSHKVCTVGTSQTDKTPLTAREKIQLMAKHANEGVIRAHSDLMRANAYSRGLFKITTSDRTVEEQAEDATALRKIKNKSYDQLSTFLDYVDTI